MEIVTNGIEFAPFHSQSFWFTSPYDLVRAWNGKSEKFARKSIIFWSNLQLVVLSTKKYRDTSTRISKVYIAF